MRHYELFKPNGLMVATIILGIDNSVGKSLKDLATFEARDKRIQEIIQIVEQKQRDASKNFMVQKKYYIARIVTNTLTGDLSFPLILKSL